MRKLRPMEVGKLPVFIPPLHGRTGAELGLSDARMYISASGHPASPVQKWMEDTGQDSNGLWKEILGRCSVEAKAASAGDQR